MVKKLFKHECLYYIRSMLPIYAILLAIATAARIIQFFEADNTLYNILNVISILSYAVAIIAVFVMSLVFTIVRYYRHLFTTEGYLSFTLPITPTQHILTKLSTAVIVHVTSLVVAFISLCVITAGDVFTEICKAAAYLIRMIPDRLAVVFEETTAAQWQTNLWIFFAEIILLMIVATIYLLLLYYSCITVGQMFHKNRVLAAVGVYFAYYLATQAVGTVLVIVSQFLPWETFAEIFYTSPFSIIHALAISYILLNLAIAVGLFFVSRYIIRNKLNLE